MTDQLLEHFWTKVKVDEVTGCWNYMAGIGTKGYGTFWNGQRDVRAHRFAYEVNKGKIPDGLVIDHLCRNRKCVNPNHMEPVTNQENCLRGLTGFGNLKTHCKRGHPYSGDNLVIHKNGSRRCKTCHALHNRISWNRTHEKPLSERI